MSADRIGPHRHVHLPSRRTHQTTRAIAQDSRNKAPITLPNDQGSAVMICEFVKAWHNTCRNANL